MVMMAQELLQGSIEMFRDGDLDGALAELESKMKKHADVAEIHHMWAEFANMKNTEAQDDVIAGRKTNGVLNT